MIDIEVADDYTDHTYNEIIDDLKETVHQDSRARIYSIDEYLNGDYLSSAGNNIYFVEISESNHPKKTVFITAGRHTGEEAGTEAAYLLVDRILNSTDKRTQDFLRDNSIVIVPAVHVDEYMKPKEDRIPAFHGIMWGNHPPEYYKQFDGDRNAGHEYMLENPNFKPTYNTNRYTLYEQLYENEPVAKETYAVAKLFDKILSEREITVAIDLHETRRAQKPVIIYYNRNTEDIAKRTIERVNRELNYDYHYKQVLYYMKIPVGVNDVFAGYATAKGVDAYITETNRKRCIIGNNGTIQWDSVSLAERTKEQLIMIDEILKNYI